MYQKLKPRLEKMTHFNFKVLKVESNKDGS